ncbi:MAG TPA: DUF4179 domain-containing protein [Clostridia bacterium]|nr:DUF4179 domain-containing protein [Clostridia bacterium]
MTERELFKEAVMQNLVDDARVKHVSKKHKRHPVARKILVAAACLLVALCVTVYSIPTARAAVEDWLNGWFTPGGYFGQEKEDRAEEPTIEAIITSADGNRAKVTEVGEGYEAYAEGFEMTLDEIAYDGEKIYISGTMSGATARPFVQPYTGGDTYRCSKLDPSMSDSGQEYDFYWCESNVDLKIGGLGYIGEITAVITEDMNPVLEAGASKGAEPVFDDGKLITTNAVTDPLWDTYLATHDVRFTIELMKMYIDMQPLTGNVQGDLTVKLYYANGEGTEYEPVLSASFGTITIDANAYQEQTQTTEIKDGTRVNLGGVHPVTITEWQPEAERTTEDGEVYYYTRNLDFTGASIALQSISFTPTDTIITIHVILPAAWTREERRGARMEYQYVLDGERVYDASSELFNGSGVIGLDYETDDYLEYDYEIKNSVLSPSQWEKAKTLTIIPTTVYWWDMKTRYDNGAYEPFSLRDDALFTGIPNHTIFEYDELYDEMTEYTLTIHLDDYR